MKIVKNYGIEITDGDGSPMVTLPYLWWDPFLQSVVMQEMRRFLPEVLFKKEEGSKFRAIFRMMPSPDDQSMRGELCGRSLSIEDPKVYIPSSEVDDFIGALDRFHQMIDNNTKCAPETREFIRTFRVIDPLVQRSAWRVTTGFNRRLIVLWGWGFSFDGNHSCVLPLTPTSSKWPDAASRVDIRKRLAEAKLISRHKFNWPKFLRYALGVLLVLGSLVLLSAVLRSCRPASCAQPGAGDRPEAEAPVSAGTTPDAAKEDAPRTESDGSSLPDGKTGSDAVAANGSGAPETGGRNGNQGNGNANAGDPRSSVSLNPSLSVPSVNASPSLSVPSVNVSPSLWDRIKKLLGLPWRGFSSVPDVNLNPSVNFSPLSAYNSANGLNPGAQYGEWPDARNGGQRPGAQYGEWPDARNGGQRPGVGDPEYAEKPEEPVFFYIRNIDDKTYTVCCTSPDTDFHVEKWYVPEFRDGAGDDGSRMMLKADVLYTRPGGNEKRVQVHDSFVLMNRSADRASSEEIGKP